MKFNEAETWLIATDPILGAVILRNGTIEPRQSADYFSELTESIISQQLSVKASDTIFRRFKLRTKLEADLVRQLTQEDAKQIGLSGQKLRYLRDLATHFVEDASVFDHLGLLDDDEVIAELTKVKGIGIWTAQMFLIFTLGRPNIFAPDDLGLQRALTILHTLPQRPTRSEALTLAEVWAPHRSTACLHLWHMLDNEPI